MLHGGDKKADRILMTGEKPDESDSLLCLSFALSLVHTKERAHAQTHLTHDG